MGKGATVHFPDKEPWRKAMLPIWEEWAPNVGGMETIQRALDKHRWNVSRAADDLGLERTNLHKKIKQYDLRRQGIDTV